MFCKLNCVKHPDGTFTLYGYSTNGTKTVTDVWHGQPNANWTAVSSGTHTVTTNTAAAQLDGTLLKITGTAVNPVRYTSDVEQDGGVWRVYTKDIKLDSSYNDTAEWTKSYSDLLGRTYKTVYPAASGTPTAWTFFNGLGQLERELDSDVVLRLSKYNGRGEVVRVSVLTIDTCGRMERSQPIVRFALWSTT